MRDAIGVFWTKVGGEGGRWGQKLGFDGEQPVFEALLMDDSTMMLISTAVRLYSLVGGK